MKCLPLLVLLSMPVVAQLPEDARKLQDSYEREANKLRLAYAQKLDALRGKYVAAGDTKNADEVGKLIAEIEGKPLAVPASSPVGKGTTKWAWGSGGEVTFQENGKAKHSSWSKSGTWKHGPDQSILLVSDSGAAFEIKFDANGIGKVRSVGGGVTTTIVQKK